MRSKSLVTLLTGWIALALNPATVSQAADEIATVSTPPTGSVTGQVQNAATGAYLEGALVAVTGASRTTLTDRAGRYTLDGLAPDHDATIEVSFSGLDAQRVAVRIESGTRTTRDIALTSTIYRMEKFTVAGEREGAARSETLQRLAPNVVNIISADTFGNRADANIANLLENVAGMAAIYNDLDARQVSIRGIDGNMNSVSMDGQQLASSAGGTGRNFFFDQHGVGNVESIEVTKAATPDMEGASVGGAINLVTKSAFDRAGGRQFTYSAGITTQESFNAYAPQWKEPLGSGFGTFVNFSFQDVVGRKRNIGISLTTTLSNAGTSFSRSVLTQGFNPATPGPTPLTGYNRQPWGPFRPRPCSRTRSPRPFHWVRFRE